jgi:hypothetical protein
LEEKKMKKIMMVLALTLVLVFGGSAVATEFDLGEVACVEIGLTPGQAARLGSMILGAVVQEKVSVAGIVFYRNPRSCDDEGSEIGPVLTFGHTNGQDYESRPVRLVVVWGSCLLDLGSVDLYGTEVEIERAKDLVLHMAQLFAIELGLARSGEKG